MTVKSKYLYFSVYLIFSVLFILILYRPIINSFFEDDLIWIIPSILQHTEGKNFFGSLPFLFSFRNQHMEIGLVNMYTYFILSLFGPQAKYFIFGSLFIHFACSALLFLLLRRLNLEFKTSFFSALMYLVIFVHYSAYISPWNVQHLLVIFFLSLVLNFYLKTNQLIENNRPYRFYYLSTLFLNLIASLNRWPIILLPFLIFILILFSARDKLDRLKKFDLWLPLFATYLFYIPLRFAFGDSRLDIFDFLPAFMKTQPIIYKFLILFCLGALVLLFIRIILKMHTIYNLRWLVFFLIIVSGSAVGIKYIYPFKLINIGGLLTAPYKVLFLFAGIQNTFLYPSNTWIETTIQWGNINLYLSPLSIFFAFILIAITIKKAILSKNKQLVIFLFWYLFCLVNPEARPGVKYTIIPSRYFIFFTPIFCFVFCMSLIEVYSYLTKKVKLKIVTQEFILIILFAPFLLSNIAAIKLAIFQNKLANNFLNYDYIRMSEIIKHDIESKNGLKDFDATDVYITNAQRLPYAKYFGKDGKLFFGLDPRSYDILQHVFVQTFNNKSLLDIKVNQPVPQKENTLFYKIDDQSILNFKGSNIDTFYQLYNRGIESLNLNRYKEAIDFFRKVAQTRPFLLNFMLGKFPIEDLYWITGSRDLRTWANQIPDPFDLFRQYKDKNKRFEDEKIEYTISIINKEISDYTKCLFYLSYLEYLSKNIEESRLLFSKISYLDKDFVTPEFWREQAPTPTKLGEQIQLFLDENRSFIDVKRSKRGKLTYLKFIFELLIYS